MRLIVGSGVFRRVTFIRKKFRPYDETTDGNVVPGVKLVVDTRKCGAVSGRHPLYNIGSPRVIAEHKVDKMSEGIGFPRRSEEAQNRALVISVEEGCYAC